MTAFRTRIQQSPPVLRTLLVLASASEGEIVRPVNNERVIVEYARIHRIFDPGLLLVPVEPFHDDLLMLLSVGLELVGRWWKREWHLGNVEDRRAGNGQLVAVSAQLGWYSEERTLDAPPPYDATRHQWLDEPSPHREGVLALFVVPAAAQFAAITSLAGDLQVPGFCRALTDILAQAEIQASSDSGGVRPKREWLVDSVDERGTFEAWVEEMALVTRVSASFHLPNPRSMDDLDPVVDYLKGVKGATGSLSASSPSGLDPYGHPIMRSAIAMQENDYGSVTGKGMKPSGEEDDFASREHPTRDVIDPDDEDPSLSLSGVIVQLLRALANRIEQGMR